jgi:hypothetical protein
VQLQLRRHHPGQLSGGLSGGAGSLSDGAGRPRPRPSPPPSCGDPIALRRQEDEMFERMKREADAGDIWGNEIVATALKVGRRAEGLVRRARRRPCRRGAEGLGRPWTRRGKRPRACLAESGGAAFLRAHGRAPCRAARCCIAVDAGGAEQRACIHARARAARARRCRWGSWPRSSPSRCCCWTRRSPSCRRLSSASRPRASRCVARVCGAARGLLVGTAWQARSAWNLFRATSLQRASAFCKATFRELPSPPPSPPPPPSLSPPLATPVSVDATPSLAVPGVLASRADMGFFTG